MTSYLRLTEIKAHSPRNFKNNGLEVSKNAGEASSAVAIPALNANLIVLSFSIPPTRQTHCLNLPNKLNSEDAGV